GGEQAFGDVPHRGECRRRLRGGRGGQPLDRQGIGTAGGGRAAIDRGEYPRYRYGLYGDSAFPDLQIVLIGKYVVSLRGFAWCNSENQGEQNITTGHATRICYCLLFGPGNLPLVNLLSESQLGSPFHHSSH